MRVRLPFAILKFNWYENMNVVVRIFARYATSMFVFQLTCGFWAARCWTVSTFCWASGQHGHMERTALVDQSPASPVSVRSNRYGSHCRLLDLQNRLYRYAYTIIHTHAHRHTHTAKGPFRSLAYRPQRRGGRRSFHSILSHLLPTYVRAYLHALFYTLCPMMSNCFE